MADKILLKIKRTSACKHRCTYPACAATQDLHRISNSNRQTIAKHLKVYVPPDVMVCANHSDFSQWLHVNSVIQNASSEFSKRYIEDMFNLMSASFTSNDFHCTNNEMLTLTSYTNDQFYQLLHECRELSGIQIDCNELIMYLMKMRTGRTFESIGHLFRVSRTVVSSKVAAMRQTLFMAIVPKYLTYERSRENLISHKTETSHILFDDHADSSQAHIVMDGTYIYVEKSKDHVFQKQTFNSHKKRNYVKMMMGTTPDGEIIFADGPYTAVDNDATITQKMLQNNLLELSGFRTGDVIIVDRGFRDCLVSLMNNGFIVKSPACSAQNQLTTMEANTSRIVTKVRYDVERINGMMKNVWKIFSLVAETYWIPHIAIDFKICAALLNRKRASELPKSSGQNDTDRNIAQRMLSRVNVPNVLAQAVRKLSFSSLVRQKKYVPFEKHTFPELTMADLKDLTFGPYQIEQAQLYLRSQLDRNDDNFDVHMFANDVVQSHLPQYAASHPDATLIMADLKSRFVSANTHRSYVLFTTIGTGSKNILEYCCVCKAGLRTVGMCSHVTALLFYLGYAPHHGGVKHICLHLKNVFDGEHDIEEDNDSD